MKARFWGVPLVLVVVAAGVQAGTVAYWRFEEGPAGANVARGGQADGVYFPAVADNSGNGYELSAWSDGGGAGYAYSATVAGPEVSGTPNAFSAKNTGGFPAMFTRAGDFIQIETYDRFTIEATFKLENGGFRTIVGRDSQGSVTGDANLAALYFQALPDNALAIKFSDVSGFWHEAISATDAFTSFDFATDPDGNLAPWYSMAAVSDGATLSLYLREVDSNQAWNLLAQTDLTLSLSPDTALTAGTGSGADWDAGNWSVGRGLYGGNHTDRAWGYVDEVRISDSALETAEMLDVLPEPAGLALLGLGVLVLTTLRRRRG